jgi:Fe-S cluster biogenesis protein NfuA
MADQTNFRAASDRIESLVRELDSVDDPTMRQNAEELIRLLTEMYGAAFGRILQILKQDEAAERVVNSLCKDSLVASLLGFHGLHPKSIETRITEALDRLQPHLSPRGGTVELVRVENGCAHLRLCGAALSSSLATSTVRVMLTKAIEEAVPEVDRVQLDTSPPLVLSRAEDDTGNDARAAHPRGSTLCELCGNGIADVHRHIAELQSRKLLCACRACSFLFEGHSEPRIKYRTVPQRYLDLPESVTAAQWDELQIPIGVAFFFFNSALNRPVACYPGPAGATESLLPLESWNSIVRAHPVLESLVVDVEVLLVDYRRERKCPRCYIVPVDACYELVARLRSHWQGFDGGDRARREMDAFFGELRSRSKGAVAADQG